MEKSKPRKLIVAKLQHYHIPFLFYNRIKLGENYEDDFGNTIPNKELTEDPPSPRSYAYCSDTIYDENIIHDVQGADLLYHEATFLHENVERATQTFHTTSFQAATIAEKAKVGKLLIGHFSGRYKDLTPLLLEAQSVFPNTDLALEGRRFKIV